MKLHQSKKNNLTGAGKKIYFKMHYYINVIIATEGCISVFVQANLSEVQNFVI